MTHYSTTMDPTDPRLRPNPWNSNVVSAENEGKIENSLSELGLFKPIIVREIVIPDSDGGGFEFQILGGEHRWRAAQRLELDEIPVYVLTGLTDVQAKKISLADNARYGVDDSLMLRQILDSLGPIEEVQEILPYTDVDLTAIFATSDIALDELDLEEPEKLANEPAAEPATRATKTHTIMRFKVQNADAERLAELIGKTKKRQGFTAGDDLTNAGDALVHLLLSGGE